MRARLIVLVAIVGCAGQSVTVTRLDEDPPARSPRYDSPAAAIQHAAFDHLARRTDLTAEERALVAALRDVEEGRLAQAEPALARLAAANSKDVRRRADIARFWTLVGQNRWTEAVASHGSDDLFARVLPLARAWAHAPPERVTFTAPSATVPADLGSQDVPFVRGRVGDHECMFLVDTGATFTMLSTDVAEAAGIRPVDAGVGVATATKRRIEVRPAVVPRLSVANVVFENHPCLVADSEDLTFTFLLFSFLRIDGVLGWNAIRSLDIEIDYRVPEVTIREPRPRSTARNLLWLGAPVVRARLEDGMPVLADLDTGASASNAFPCFFDVLPEGYWQTLTGNVHDGSAHMWGAGGSERVRTRTVDRLTIVVDRHRLQFRRLPAHGHALTAIFVPVVRLGNDIALKGTMRIDFKNSALELGP
ncbi:MAG TPA: retropepsin-like aspartic protease [Planctomycetota bacterium]|nr:retropepsin-like aspartic protease [Planctomycetota bacterium]